MLKTKLFGSLSTSTSSPQDAITGSKSIFYILLSVSLESLVAFYIIFSVSLESLVVLYMLFSVSFESLVSLYIFQ